MAAADDTTPSDSSTTDQESKDSRLNGDEGPDNRDEQSQTTPKTKPRTKRRPAAKPANTRTSKKKPPIRQVVAPAKFPRHPVDRALRIPRVIIDQNAGHPCTRAEAAKYLGVSTSGAFDLEISSAKKYGFLESRDQKLAVTERAKRVLRPQSDTDETAALREAVLVAPDISEVYNHYRGEHLPDDNFFSNALIERFEIPADKILDFRAIFLDSLRAAHLLDESGDRPKLIDIGREEVSRSTKPSSPTAKPSAPAGDAKTAKPFDDSCFVVQPFAEPFGGYYESLFKPAIEKAGLRPFRADAEIFGTGKIMDQVWRGIRSSKVLLAELTTKNANVYYELGLAHALGKAVVLLAANEEDVPFDLRHIRVIYYDRADPFWGNKLVDKIAENLRSALENPEEAIFKFEDI